MYKVIYIMTNLSLTKDPIYVCIVSIRVDRHKGREAGRGCSTTGSAVSF